MTNTDPESDPAESDPTEFDPHRMDPDDFLDEVHSFEFWFQAVEGYLTDRPFGHASGEEPISDRPDELSESDKDSLITTLCNYCVGETAALEGASGMIAIAPNRHSKIFLATQVADEARHLEVFLRRLADLGVTDPEAEIERRANPTLQVFKRRLLELVRSGDWSAALLAQNVILESMEHSAFMVHAASADPVTAEILDGVMKDERRHLGFGENDLGRLLSEHPGNRRRLADIRQELDGLVLAVFSRAADDIPGDRSMREDMGREYMETMDRLGLV